MLKKYNDSLIIVINLETEELYQSALTYLQTIEEFKQLVDIGLGMYRVEFFEPKPERLQGLNRRVAVFHEAYEASNNIMDMAAIYKGSNIGLLWAYKNLGFSFAMYYLLVTIWPYFVGIPGIPDENFVPTRWFVYGYRLLHFAIAAGLMYQGAIAGSIWLTIPLFIIGFVMICSTAFAYTLMLCFDDESKGMATAILTIFVILSALFLLLVVNASAPGVVTVLVGWAVYLLIINPYVLYNNK